jgi:hypothetical protein
MTASARLYPHPRRRRQVEPGRKRPLEHGVAPEQDVAAEAGALQDLAGRVAVRDVQA